MSDSLMKPCPCCGEQESVKITSEYDEGNYAIICDMTDGGCGCCGGYRLDLDDAIEVWNRRAPAQQPAAAPSNPLGMASCGKPLCSDADHHPLCSAGDNGGPHV